MKMTRRLTSIGVAAAAVASAMTVMAPPASADSAYGCAYPRVCFYPNDSAIRAKAPTASYQDVTNSYQDLGPASRGADWVVNTRNDDRAYLRYLDGGTTREFCLAPNSNTFFVSSLTVTGIRIDNAATCP
jgi:hypothetical protein